MFPNPEDSICHLFHQASYMLLGGSRVCSLRFSPSIFDWREADRYQIIECQYLSCQVQLTKWRISSQLETLEVLSWSNPAHDLQDLVHRQAC